MWMSLNLTNEKSALVQVMAWCHQSTSHYLSQCWPRSLLVHIILFTVNNACFLHKAGLLQGIYLCIVLVPMTLDSFTVSLHRSNSRKFALLVGWEHKSTTSNFVTPTALSCINNSWRSTTLPAADSASSNQTLPFQNEHEWVLEKLR